MIIRVLFLNAVLIAVALPLWAQESDVEDEIPYTTGASPQSAAERALIPPTPLARTFLPELVDLSSRFPKVGNQGRLGSCTSWAVGYAARSYYETVRDGRTPGSDQIPSPAYMHAIVRDRSVPDCEGGAAIKAALDLLMQEGAASLTQVRYTDKVCPVLSPDMREEIRQSGSLKIFDWRQVASNGWEWDAQGNATLRIGSEKHNLPDMFKAELARGNPVITAVQIDDAFDNLRGRAVWHRRAPVDFAADNWHAITIVGYNERGQYFKFINSWGTRWGDKGYGRLSYQTIIDHDYAGYVLSVAGADPNPNPPAPDPEPDPAPEPQPDPVPEPDVLVLPDPGCGKIQLAEGQDRQAVTGFVGSQNDLDALIAAVAGKDVAVDVALRPWPQCETLLTLDAPLNLPDRPRIDLPKAEYAKGETLSFSVAMAGYDGFLHIAYVQADGTVVHLSQQSATGLRTSMREAVQIFGDGADGRPRFEVAPPFGAEMIVAIASASPLFEMPRPTVELEREFLTALRKAILARPDPDLPERRITASYEILRTKEH